MRDTRIAGALALGLFALAFSFTSVEDYADRRRRATQEDGGEGRGPLSVGFARRYVRGVCAALLIPEGTSC